MTTATSLDYSAAGVPVREDLQQAHRELLDHIATPGPCWSGAERVAIAAESRRALDCELCRRRKGALSPAHAEGEHDQLGALPEPLVDVIHRVRTDPGRLSKAWFDATLAGGLDETAYVEAIGVVTLLAGLDHFTRALGVPTFPLPQPKPGAADGYRPAAAKPGVAWVSMIDPAEASGPEADLYGGAAFVPNIVRALSQVPGHVRALRRFSSSHYVPMEGLRDPSVRRDLDRMQIELIAARVSALNECFY